jgi:superfamily I DNA/RNA helicase
LQQVQSLLRTRSEIKPSDICIAARTKHALAVFKSAFFKAGIQFYEIYDRAKSKNADGLALSTFHGMKGLEFKHIYLVDVSSNSFPFKHTQFEYLNEVQKNEYLQSERSLLYVAATRAVLDLSITGSGRMAEF